MKVTDCFNLGKAQNELDFVDVPVNSDIALFVDPFAISLVSEAWFAACSNLIVSYFQNVLNGVRAGDIRRVQQLLSNLREPDETHLGFSQIDSSGRGIGPKKAAALSKNLANSKAARSGLLQDLHDAELFIPNISHDGISDISLNVIRSQLISYTQAQAALNGIPLVSGQTVGPCWNERTEQWENQYWDLPVANSKSLVLVPKVAVRRHLSIDSQSFYSHEVMDYLVAEFEAKGASLAKVLKGGRRKVYKKDIKDRHPLTKKFLADFVEEHPSVLKEYKNRAGESARVVPTDDEIDKLNSGSSSFDAVGLAERIEKLGTGAANATEYQHLICGALEAIFSPMLFYPKLEQRINDGRKRIDIVFSNIDKDGFFHRCAVLRQLPCPTVVFECKNCTDDPANNEFDQLYGRLSDSLGRVGFVVCRDVKDRDLAVKRCRDYLVRQRSLVMFLTDADIKELLVLRRSDEIDAVDRYLEKLASEITRG